MCWLCTLWFGKVVSWTLEGSINDFVRNLPFFRYVFTLLLPNGLEVTAELVPHHKHVVGCDLLLTRLWLHPKISYCCFKTATGQRKGRESEVEGEKLSMPESIRVRKGTLGVYSLTREPGSRWLGLILSLRKPMCSNWFSKKLSLIGDTLGCILSVIKTSIYNSRGCIWQNLFESVLHLKSMSFTSSSFYVQWSHGTNDILIL